MRGHPEGGWEQGAEGAPGGRIEGRELREHPEAAGDARLSPAPVSLDPSPAQSLGPGPRRLPPVCGAAARPRQQGALPAAAERCRPRFFNKGSARKS